jgi:VanZ family protein
MQGASDRARPLVIPRGAAAIAWAALAAFVLYGSIRPVAGDGQSTEASPGISVPDITQNVLLYIPFGVFGVWTLRRDTSSRIALWARVTALAAVCSTSIEVLQLPSASRIASPLDVLANLLGACGGAMASEPIERAVGTAAHLVRPTGLLTAPARYGLAVVLAAIVLVAWYPFDVTLDVSTLSERTREVRRDPWLWPGMTELWGQGARFFVLGAILTACLPGLAKRAAPVAAVAVVAIAVVIDLGQLAMGSDPVGGAVLVSQAAGAWAGAICVLTLARCTWYAAA